MDPLVLTSLIVTCAVQSLVIAFLAATVPFLWWKAFGLDRRLGEEATEWRKATIAIIENVEELDDVTDALCKAAGMAREDVKP